MKDNKEKTIYWFITVFEKVETDRGWPDIGARRVWGFYTDKEVALKALHENWTDMWETCYDYAVLEPYYEGISGIGDREDRQFFEYDADKDGYFEIDEPREVRHVAGFAFG